MATRQEECLAALGFRILSNCECGVPASDRPALPGLLLERASKLHSDRQQGGDALTIGGVLYVKCLGACCAARPLELHSSGGCIFSGNAFEAHAGRSYRKKWRETIRVLPANVSLKAWLASVGRDAAALRDAERMDSNRSERGAYLPESREALMEAAVAAVAAAAAAVVGPVLAVPPQAELSPPPLAPQQQTPSKQQLQPAPFKPQQDALQLSSLQLLEQVAVAATRLASSSSSSSSDDNGGSAAPATTPLRLRLPLAARAESFPSPLATGAAEWQQSLPPTPLPQQIASGEKSSIVGNSGGAVLQCSLEKGVRLQPGTQKFARWFTITGTVGDDAVKSSNDGVAAPPGLLSYCCG